MDISRELAIQILKYLSKHRSFYFPFQVMNRLGSGDEAGFVEVEPREWKSIEKESQNQSFQLWENLQGLDRETTSLMAKGFIEKITGDLRKGDSHD